MTKVEVDKILIDLKDTVGDKVSLSLCKDKGVSRRIIEKYYGSFNGVLEFLGFKPKSSIRGRSIALLSRDEVDEKLKRLAKEYGETLSLTICKANGLPARQLYEYYSSMADARISVGLSEGLTSKNSQERRELTKEDFDSQLKQILSKYNNNITLRILKSEGVGVKSINKFYGSYTNLCKLFKLRISSQEAFLDWLEKRLGESIEREVTFNTLINPKSGKHLRFDGYIGSRGILIEYDDASHFETLGLYGDDSSLAERKERDLFKDSWAKENNLFLFRFDYRYPWNFDAIKKTLDTHTSYVAPKVNRYRGIFLDNRNKKWCVLLRSKNYYYNLGLFEDPLYAAIVREKFIIENNLPAIKNNLSISDLEKYGFSSWEDVPLVSSQRKTTSIYYGVRTYRNMWIAEQTVKGKITYIGSGSTDEEAAILREEWLNEHPDCKGRRNKIKGYNC